MKTVFVAGSINMDIVAKATRHPCIGETVAGRDMLYLPGGKGAMIKIRLIRQEQTRLEPGLVVPVMREHLGIIDAFESRNPERAAAAIGSHIMNARARALGAMD